MVTFDIFENIKSSYDEILNDPNHRYKSWEHSYCSFNNFLAGEIDLDQASLNLAFYLASWGMMRGSSHLLQKDYRVHLDSISILCKEEYQILHNLDISCLRNYSEEMDLIFSLIKELSIEYAAKGISPTNTLITKILLGTYCCLPAYDSFFISGIRKWNQKNNIKRPNERITQSFGKRSVHSLVEFYFINIDEFNKIQEYISSNGIFYPPMKLIDMYFWNLV
jgi:hypothetical protein